MSEAARTGRLDADEKQALLRRIIESRRAGAEVAAPSAPPAKPRPDVPEAFHRIDRFPRYQQMQLHRALAERAGLASPFFLVNDGVGRDTIPLAGRPALNFSTYNYLGLNGDPRVTRAAFEAAQRYGTSASASRLVGGERPPHRALERALADLHGAQDAITFVSGFSANLSIISTLVGPRDLLLLDRLVHNSVVQGAKLSGAAVQTFPHNDMDALEASLAAGRSRYERVLVVAEGIYSMDGDICPLDRLVEIKARWKTLLMIDEAHSIGVLGETGRGVGEHFGVPAAEVDVWMGTLSKTLAGCGGYAAGSTAMVELMKFTAPGFIYSVGMPPPMAAASLTALQIMLSEPERVRKLRRNGATFMAAAAEAGLDTGSAAGLNIVPVILGGSVATVRLSNRLAERGVQVNPIVFPAVEEQQARLRFFLSSDHSEAQLREAVAATVEALAD